MPSTQRGNPRPSSNSNTASLFWQSINSHYSPHLVPSGIYLSFPFSCQMTGWVKVYLNADEDGQPQMVSKVRNITQSDSLHFAHCSECYLYRSRFAFLICQTRRKVQFISKLQQQNHLLSSGKDTLAQTINHCSASHPLTHTMNS